MAVYIDNFYVTGITFGRMKMSHMIADTREELLEMAIKKLGMKQGWIQDYDTPREHFDVALGNRKKAIEFGAIEIGFRELAEMTRTRNYEGKTQSILA